MKVSDVNFNRLRTIVEIIGYIGTFLLAVSDVFGYKYGTQLAAVFSALMICLGSIVTALRNEYNNTMEATKTDELD